MCQMTLNNHAKFHGDRTIGGAITVKEAFKNTIFQLYINATCKKTFIFSSIHIIFTSYDRKPHSEQLCLWEYFHQSKCYLNISIMFKIYFCELVLGFLPDRNQTTAEMFSVKWIWIIIEKKFKFHLRFAKGRKNVRKRRGQFHFNSYNSWTEWDIFTKLRKHVYDIDFWSN